MKKAGTNISIDSSDPTIWDLSLTRKLRNTLNIKPITDIKNSFLQDPAFKERYKRYDPLAIALKILQVVVDHMGAYTGITEKELVEKVSPLLHKMDKKDSVAELSPEEYERIIKIILQKLTFQKSREGWEISYTDYNRNPPAVCTKHIRIISYRNYGDKIVLFAEPEGTNFFLQMLDIDLEDQQQATMQILTRQLKGGEFNNALEMAQQNLWLTNQYELKVEDIISQTRRNLAQIDWVTDIPANLKRAMDHIKICIELQSEQKKLVNQQLQILDVEQVVQRGALIKLNEHLNRSLSKLLPLQQKINEARKTFLDEQWFQQLFQKQTNRINLEQDLFDKFMRITFAQSPAVINAFFPHFSGCKDLKVLTFDRFVELALKDSTKAIQVPIKKLPEIIQEIKSVDLTVYTPELQSDLNTFLVAHLQKRGQSSTLDEIIIDAINSGKDFTFCNFLRLIIQINYSKRKSEENKIELKLGVDVLGRPLQNPLFEGNNYTVLLEEGARNDQ